MEMLKTLEPVAQPVTALNFGALKTVDLTMYISEDMVGMEFIYATVTG